MLGGGGKHISTAALSRKPEHPSVKNQYLQQTNPG